MNKFVGSFLGFMFCGQHSSDFNIVRVIDSNRFKDSLVPEFKDETVDIPGADGVYYFGTTFDKRTFEVSFAFDQLSETKLRELRQWLNKKDVGSLIFDETPYKQYSAKVGDSATLSYLCFTENGEKVYKGTGNVSFVCYYPFATSIYEYGDTIEAPGGFLYLNESGDWGLLTYTEEEAGLLTELNDTFNINIVEETKYEWKEAIGLPSEQEYGTIDANGELRLNNVGDMEMPFEVWYKLPITGKFGVSQTGRGMVKINNTTTWPISASGAYLVVDMREFCVYECDSMGKRTGKLFNNLLTERTFFNLPTGECLLKFDGQLPEKVVYHYIYY